MQPRLPRISLAAKAESAAPPAPQFAPPLPRPVPIMRNPGPIRAANPRQGDPQNECRPKQKETTMKKERRWLKSVIAASLEPQVALPWQRTARKKPASLKAAPARAMATAAR